MKSYKSKTFFEQPGWRYIGDKHCYFKSKWEVRYAWHLHFLKNQKEIVDWQYEPETFWFENIKRGVRSYKPDFMVLLPQDQRYWVEVKGHMDQRSKTKLARFKRFYPKEKLTVIDSEWFVKMRSEGKKISLHE